MRTLLERAILARYPGAQSGLDFRLIDRSDGIEIDRAFWRLAGDPPAEAEVATLAAQYDAAEAQAQQEATALRQRILNSIQGAVGKNIDPQSPRALTAGERTAINAAAWYVLGIITKNGDIRPPEEWLK